MKQRGKKVLFLVFFLFVIMLLVFAGSQEQKKASEEVYKQLEKNGEANVIVKVKETQGAFMEEEENLIGIKITKKDLEKLEKDRKVEKIEFSPRIKAFLQDSVQLINATTVWQIQNNNINITGIDETVCVIDTGVNFSHPALIGKNKTCNIDCYNKDCIENCSVIDDSGHGTHNAGIIAASSAINGVATEASIISLKILDETGWAHETNGEIDLINAIEWCIENKYNYNISVMSLSLGTEDLYSDYCDDYYPSIAEVINNATFYNISVIFATGNEAESTTEIAAPACIQNSTAVGSIRKNDANFDYNRNAITDLIAPGYLINSTRGYFGSCLSGCSCAGNYLVCSGTSMATPHVAGAFALMHQYLKLQNGHEPKPYEIENILKNSSKVINDSDGSGLNFSRIDVYSALLSIDSSNPTVNLVSPQNSNLQFSQNVSFRCSANDAQLSNITLYVWNSSGIYNNTELRQVSGTNTNQEFNLTNIPYGNYKWNCLAYDKAGNFSFSSSNYSLFIRIGPLIFGVLHSIHTTVSDGTMSLSQRVSNLQSEYNWASTVEHDSQINTSEWISIKNESNENNTDNNFTYFIGYEWKGTGFNNAEVLVFFNDSGPAVKINGNETGYDTPIELTSWLASNNGIGCINHPARAANYVNWSGEGINNQTYLPCVEILNKQYYHWNDYWNCSQNSGCTTYANPKQDTSNWNGSIKNALDNGLHLGFVAGWDYHGSYPGPPSAYTGLVDALNWTREDVFEIIRRRHTWAAEDRILMDIKISNGSDTFVMGDIFNTSYNGSHLDFSINATAGKSISNLSLFYDGIIINLTQFSNQQNVSGFFNLTFSDSNEHYIFIEAIESDGNRSWSSPVYITYRDLMPPSITLNSPSSTTYTSSSVIFNVSLNEDGYCEYSLNDGTTNHTMSSEDNVTWYSTSTLSNGAYTAVFYCNDTKDNKNYSEEVSFIVAISAFQTPSGGSGGGTNVVIYRPTTEQLNQGYFKELKKGESILFSIINLGKEEEEYKIIIKSVLEDSVVFLIESTTFEKNIILGEGEKVDLTVNSSYNLEIRLNNIKGNLANVTILSRTRELNNTINPPTEEDKEGEKGEENNALNSAGEKNINTVQYMLIVIIVCITGVTIVILLQIRKNKHEKTKTKPQRKEALSPNKGRRGK
ncbi:hypothetical protein A3K73_07570 [Candidatus Pacearchaeota archaeon RBG_13_36_9]|nr:MAG: hypothetical protein A3K73_07570 [Candidatus Pacearchaeota archaeon RBG_13_36_9]